ncbi:MAG: SufS family cysteine desulfurase [Pirellulaceae bacterium]|nr:SufS family cysteine desulfurase [Pirellulaceae bacterium]MDP7018676.1 SufS family cysteine desulfurase [Pirellulaceae bacterium]
MEASALDAAALRADFPILASLVHDGRPLVYLDSAASTQRPTAVIQAMTTAYEREYANVHRGVHWMSERCTDRYEAAREAVRRYINASAVEEVVFTSGTTAALNLVAHSWGDAHVGAGDEILVTEMEHHSNIVPWFQLAERRGAAVKFAPITDDGVLDLEGFAERLSQRTKVVAVSAVSNVLGTINPVARIVAAARAAGAVVVVDGAQGVPHGTTDVQQLGADFLAFSGHKMAGPSGIGVLWGRRELLDAMPPFLGGGSMIGEVTVDGFTSADLPAKFEAGTPPIVPAIGLAAAIEYVEQIGVARIAAHEQRLTAYAHEHLEALTGVRLLGPPAAGKSGIVSFVIDGVHAHDVAYMLDRGGVAIRAGHHCAMPLHKRLGITASNRASFYLYNTPADIDAMLKGIDQLQEKFRKRQRRRRSAR